MPGTVSKFTDPTLVSSSFNSSSSSKASLESDPIKHSLVVTSSPEHPSSGVASTGAAQLIASGATTSSLAPSNSPAQAVMAAVSKNSSSGGGGGKSGKKGGNSSSSSNGGGGKIGKTNIDSTGDKAKDAELVKFIETNGHFSLVRNFHLADAFTLMNGFCGAQSLFASGRYLVTSNPKYAWTALWFPFFGCIFDLLDGKVARWRNSSSMLGQELDSLADLVSFGAAPAFAAFALGLRLPLDSLILTMFVCAGIARLARFNVTTASIPHDSSGKARYFEGLPIPSSLVLVGGMALCLMAGRVAPGGLPIALAKEKGGFPSQGFPFTNRLHDVIPGANLGTGVPFGTFGYDASQQVVQYLSSFALVKQRQELKDVIEVIASFANIEVHKISLLWGAWAVAMVSKTLRVPKP